jgi:hypothetical protein
VAAVRTFYFAFSLTAVKSCPVKFGVDTSLTYLQSTHKYSFRVNNYKHGNNAKLTVISADIFCVRSSSESIILLTTICPKVVITLYNTFTIASKNKECDSDGIRSDVQQRTLTHAGDSTKGYRL